MRGQAGGVMPGIVITNVAAPPEVAPGSDYQVEVTVQSQTILPLPRMARVQLQITGQPVGQAQAVIPPRATAKFTFQVRAPDVPSTMNVPHKVVLLTVIAGIFPIPRGALAFVVTMNPGGSTLPPEPVQPIDAGNVVPIGHGGIAGGQAGAGGAPGGGQTTAPGAGTGGTIDPGTVVPFQPADPGQQRGSGTTYPGGVGTGTIDPGTVVPFNPEGSGGSPSAPQTNLPGAGTSRLISGVG